MNKLILSALVGATTCTLALPVLAGNDAPNGPHYNLNIIGVEKAKKADMTNSNRHTIFVPLVSTKREDGIVDSKIWLTPGEDFKVCDGNGFDPAYGCPDENDISEQFSNKDGAVFQLPCNTNLSGYWDSDGNGKIEEGVDSEVELISCNETVDTTTGVIVPVAETDVVPTAHYQVWARALGKPQKDDEGGTATITTCATVQDELQCSMENTVQTRTKGKSSFTEVTDQLTSLVVTYCWQYDADGICIEEIDTRVALFSGDTEDWFWNYDNNGLKLLQLRFYEVPQE